MRKFIRSLTLFLLGVFLLANQAHARRGRLAFLVQEGLPSLTERPIEGFRAAFKTKGFEQGRDYKIISHKVFSADAEGGKAAAAEVTKLLDKGVDLVVTVGTAPSVGAWKVLQHTRVPQIYMVVTDPVNSGLIPEWGAPSGKNITGVSFYADPQEEFKLARQLAPNGKKFVFPYLPSLPADTVRVEQFKNAKNKYGFDLEIIDVTTEAQRAAYHARTDIAVSSGWLGYVLLAGKGTPPTPPDGVYPISTALEESIGSYIVAGVMPDTYVIGQQAAIMASKVISEEQDIAAIPSEDPKKWSFLVNMALAKERKLKGINYNIILGADKVVTVMKIPAQKDFILPGAEYDFEGQEQ